MSNTENNIETEVKYLIEMPNLEALKSREGCTEKKILQTYLLSQNGTTRRIRQTVSDGEKKYILTEKIRISSLSAYENEKEITEEEYISLLRQADKSRRPIEKTRYAFPHRSHTVEIDIYPFWKDRAILEIELLSESDEYSIPDFIKVLKNVTDDKRYKNVNLALNPVFDDI